MSKTKDLKSSALWPAIKTLTDAVTQLDLAYDRHDLGIYGYVQRAIDANNALALVLEEYRNED